MSVLAAGRSRFTACMVACGLILPLAGVALADNWPIPIGPFCPNQAITVRNTTINASLVLGRNGAIVGYGGAATDAALLDVGTNEPRITMIRSAQAGIKRKAR